MSHKKFTNYYLTDIFVFQKHLQIFSVSYLSDYVLLRGISSIEFGFYVTA